MSFDLSNVDVSGARLPSTYNAAKRAVSQCASLDECKDWADKSAALASYAKQAQDDQLEQMAKRIRARALRRAGELLKQIPPGKTGPRIAPAAEPNRTEVAEAAGMTKRQKNTAIAFASVPEDDFEEMVETGATLTQIAAAGIQRPAPDREEGRKLVAALKAHADRMSGINLDEATASLDQVQVAQVRMLVGRLDSYHDRVVTSL